jgi:thiosulfate reductase cytochrome b subunit
VSLTTVRLRRSLIWLVPCAVVALVVAVLAARWLLTAPAAATFFATYPGEVPPPIGTPEGIPAWLNWSHFLNSFFLVFIVSSGLRIRSKERPPAFWTRDPARFPRLTGAPKRLSIHTWWHLVVDSLFVLNGLVYLVLLFATGQWQRIVPLSWDVVPNAVSAGIQYLAFAWPTHDGWVVYNSLQQLSYFATVFVAGPLALLTGLRLSPGWPAKWTRPMGLLGDRAARRAHGAALWYYIAFTIVHVGLVLLTGARHNLNTMYAANDGDGWLGVALFVLSLLATAGAWWFLRQSRVTALAKRTGTVREMPAPRKPAS